MLGDRGYEVLEKAIYKQRTQAVIDPLEYYLPLIVVPRTILSWLVQTIKPMKTGEIKDVKFPGRDDIAIHFEKQDIDQYRAEFVQSGKIIHSFEKQSLPAASGHLMTVGELYDDLDKPKSSDDLVAEEVKANPELDKPKEEGPKPEFSALQHMISMANVSAPHDPEAVKWEMSHASVRELTGVIGKLIDSLAAKKMSSDRLEDELGKVTEKEVKGDAQKRENAQTPEEKNKKDIAATAANPAIKTKQEGILEIRDNKAKPTQQLAEQAIPEQKVVKDGTEAASGDIKKESMKEGQSSTIHAASINASKNISSPRMAGAQNDQDKQRGILQRMAPMNTSKGYFRKKAEILTKPYVSDAQRKWAHTAEGTKALGGDSHVHEWDEATKGKKLPEHVKKEELGKLAPPTSKEKGVNRPIAGTSHMGIQASNESKKAVAHSVLAEQRAMPKANLPKSEDKAVSSHSSPTGSGGMTNAKKPAGSDFTIAVGKSEMPKGAGQPKGPQMPQAPKPPVPAGNAPAASAAKQAQSAGTGGYKPPQTPGAVKPKNPTMAKSDYFRGKLDKCMGKSMRAAATEEQLYKSACPECGTPEFKKAADGHPEFNPCACFRVLKKDEEGRPVKFVTAIKKGEGNYGLEFDPNADPEAVKMFLLTLKARLLIKKKLGQ